MSSIFPLSDACVLTRRSWISDATAYVSSGDERREQPRLPDRVEDLGPGL